MLTPDEQKVLDAIRFLNKRDNEGADFQVISIRSHVSFEKVRKALSRLMSLGKATCIDYKYCCTTWLHERKGK
jgi:Mn-dependent DtxR family transcriptional regulator